MTHRIGLSLALVFSAALVAAQDKKGDGKPFNDAEFVKKAASGGMHEVELGKLAQTAAKSDEVKKFGQKLVEDHTKANEELKKAAKAAGVSVPEKMLDEHRKEFDRFKDLKGDAFDREFAKHQVKDHEEDIALFTRASKEASSADIKGFATKSLPVLKEHLEMAKKLNPGK